jgi:hypothetical protein
MAKQKAHASTQKFTELTDIVDNVVILEGGRACLVIEVTGTNFALLSQKEQDSRIFSYASLLNSLSFPLQVLIRNKRVDISSYLKELEEAEKQTQNRLLAEHISQYRDFVREMVKVNVVLNKNFYLVIPYSSLEKGVGGAKQAVAKSSTTADTFVEDAKKALLTKADEVLAQVRKFAVAAQILEKEELVKLFYDVYNEGLLDATQVETDSKTVLIKGGTQQAV